MVEVTAAETNDKICVKHRKKIIDKKRYLLIQAYLVKVGGKSGLPLPKIVMNAQKIDLLW